MPFPGFEVFNGPLRSQGAETPAEGRSPTARPPEEPNEDDGGDNDDTESLEEATSFIFDYIVDLYIARAQQMPAPQAPRAGPPARRVTRKTTEACAICGKPTKEHSNTCFVVCGECGVRGGIGRVGDQRQCVMVPTSRLKPEPVKLEMKWTCPACTLNA